MNNDYILMFVDYLIIPLISVGIGLKRKGKTETFDRACVFGYAGYVTAIAITVYVIRLVLSRLGIGVDTDAGTGVYTVIATVVALIAPYVKEIFEAYVNVRCEIKGKKESHSDEK